MVVFDEANSTEKGELIFEVGEFYRLKHKYTDAIREYEECLRVRT